MKELLFLYLLVVILIGFTSIKKIKNPKDFFIAGKEAGVFQITGSLLASMIGSSAIIGSVSFAYTSGWAGAWFMLCAAIGLAFLLPLIKYMRDFKGYNLPGMLGVFYGESVKQLASIIIPIAWIGVVASQVIGAANIIGILTGYSYETGVLIIGIVFIVYTILGGQFSIIKTDFIQLMFILLGIFLTFGFIVPEDITIKPLPIINSTFTFMDLIVLLLTYSTTYIVGPDIYSRLFCAKDEKTIKKSILFTIITLIPLAYIFARLGIYGQQVLTAELIGKDSVLLVIAHNKLPKLISVSLYFGLLSAVISTADTSLLTASSLFTQAVIKDLKKENSILYTRIFTVIFGIFSMIVALKMAYILPTILLALAVYSGAFIIPTLLGLLGFKASEKYVIAAVILGGVISLVGKLKGGDIGNYISISAFFVNALVMYLGRTHKK